MNPSSKLKTPKFKAVLFDLDGTLVDTEPAAARAVESCFHGWGIRLTPADSGYVTGRTWESAIDYFYSKYKIPVAKDEATEQLLAEYRRAMREKLHVVPGSVAAVQALGAKLPLALVSGSYREEILFVLDHLKIREHFGVVLGAEDYIRSKPDPESYAKAVELLGVAASECVVFEDSQAGIAAALGAGLRVIAITGTNHFKQNVSAAHHRIPDLRGVTPQWLAGLTWE